MKRILLSLILILTISGSALAQLDGARVYWPLPKNTNIVGAHGIFGTINASWSNWEMIQPNADIKNNLYMFTYTRVQPIFDRTTSWTFMAPAGQIETNTSLSLGDYDPFVHGFGDIGFSCAINIFGAPGLKAKEYIRYDLNTVVDFGIQATFPTGQYDADEPINMGSNQFKFRFSLPIVKAIGPWVPGKRLTLEAMPSLTVLTKNDENQGYEIKQDPIFMVESHLTRDLTKRSFVSLDYSFIHMGKTTATDLETDIATETESRDTHLLGATINFTINDNLQLYLTHMQTLDEKTDPVTLEGALLKVSLIYSWHGVLQKVSDFHND